MMPPELLTDEQRERFDAIFERVVAQLPEHVREMIERVPVVIEDSPADDVLDYFEQEDGVRPLADELCGLHSGTALTEGGNETAGDLPSQIMLYRIGIIAAAGGWEIRRAKPGEFESDSDAGTRKDQELPMVGGEESIYEQIVITLLHEIGHEFGLEEDDLDNLGFG